MHLKAAGLLKYVWPFSVRQVLKVRIEQYQYRFLSLHRAQRF